MELYCEKERDTNEYSNFFKNKTAVAMCGAKKEDIVKVYVTETSGVEGDYWAYKDLEEGEIRYIFKSEKQVKMCSPDFFRSKIKEGKGKIIQVKVIVNSN